MIMSRYTYKMVGLASYVLISTGCGDKAPTTYQGYAEGEFVHIAAPFAGSLDSLAVARGQQVTAKAPLFVLEQASELAARRETEARVEAAQARLANLKAGRRPSEVEAISAQSLQASAMRELSASQLARQERLFVKGFISQASLDEARAINRRDLGKVAEAEAQTKTAKSSVGREAEIDAAQRELEATKAVLSQSDWKLAQKTVSSPVSGLVQDTFFSRGEWVPAGQPVVSLLPPENIKVRFFVPETIVASLKVGQSVSVTCDACGEAIASTISFIAPQPEFTPPIIYSKESRGKLVFYIEAKPARELATKLHPGQPLDVAIK